MTWVGITLYLVGVMCLGSPRRSVRWGATPCCWLVAWLTTAAVERDDLLYYGLFLLGVAVATLAQTRRHAPAKRA